jgi:hypothetical protein
MSYATDDTGAFVYPQVQTINGVLTDMTTEKTGDWRIGMQSAIKNKDYIDFDNEDDARYFTENYKKGTLDKHFDKANGGSISKMGYKDTSPYNKASSLMIHSPNGSITMNGVSKDLIGIDEYGNQQYMKANSGDYQFQGQQITEIPAKQDGGLVDRKQKGQSLGSLIGGGLGLASSLFGVPPQLGMSIGSNLGSTIGGGLVKEDEIPPIQSYNTVNIAKANNGLKLNNMNTRDLIKQYGMGGQMKKSYQEGGVVEGEGALPHSEGGVPAVDETGQQIAEIEGGERIDSVDDTATQEQMISQLMSTQDPQERDAIAMQLGYFVAEMTMKQDQAPTEMTEATESVEPPAQPIMRNGGVLKSTFDNYLSQFEPIRKYGN